MTALLALFVSAALAREVCDRPIPPEDLAPPSAQADSEFRAFLNAEYQDYLGAAEAYLNCLGREHQSIFEEIRRTSLSCRLTRRDLRRWPG